MQRVSGRLPRSSQKRKQYLALSKRQRRQWSPEKPVQSWPFTSGDDGRGRRRDETVWTVWSGVMWQHRPATSAGTAFLEIRRPSVSEPLRLAACMFVSNVAEQNFKGRIISQMVLLAMWLQPPATSLAEGSPPPSPPQKKIQCHKITVM